MKQGGGREIRDKGRVLDIGGKRFRIFNKIICYHLLVI